MNENVWEKLDQTGLTKDVIAEYLGISRDRLYRIINGTVPPAKWTTNLAWCIVILFHLGALSELKDKIQKEK